MSDKNSKPQPKPQPRPVYPTDTYERNENRTPGTVSKKNR